MPQDSQAILFYVHDPMCSWCWAFAPTWAEIKQNLPEHIKVRYLLGGLASDSNEPMPSAIVALLCAKLSTPDGSSIWQQFPSENCARKQK